MIPVPVGVKVWLATGHTDMREGFPGLSLIVQETLKRDPMCGHLFVFSGRGGGLIKVICHDGQGACLFHEEAAMWTLHIAVSGRWDGDDYRRSLLPRLANTTGSPLADHVNRSAAMG